MKPSIVLTAVCAMIFLNAGVAASDEKTDLELNQKIEALRRTVDALTDEIEALKRDRPAAGAGEVAEEEETVIDLSEPEEEVIDLSGDEEVLDLSDMDEAGGADVAEAEDGGGGALAFGGHLKFYLLDRSEGERNKNDQNNNLSAGFHNMYLYLSKGLSSWLMLDVQTKTAALAGATPQLGSDISRSTSGSVSTKITEAAITARIPYGVELKAGVFDPIFSEEYGKQLWWHEQYHGDYAMLRVQESHDIGIELYRNFDFDRLSLPVYLYLLNGDDSSTYMSDTYTYVDNNGGKSVMFHVAPSIFVDFINRLKFLGSFGYGRWDEEDDKNTLRYAIGFDMQIKGVTLTGEYLSKQFDDVPLTGGGVADGDREGYYIKGLYSITDKWRAVAKYSHAELYKASETMLTDTYDTVSFGVNYFIMDSSTIMPQISFSNADRSDGSEDLEYSRFTLGWRTTF